MVLAMVVYQAWRSSSMASGNKWLERAGWAVASQGIGEESVGLARPRLAADAPLGNF